MPGRACLVLLAGLAGATPIISRAADDELARVPQPNAPAGRHSDFAADNPIGRFMDLLAEGAVAEARALQPKVCAAWIRGEGAERAWSGRFIINGVEISLDRLCRS